MCSCDTCFSKYNYLVIHSDVYRTLEVCKRTCNVFSSDYAYESFSSNIFHSVQRSCCCVRGTPPKFPVVRSDFWCRQEPQYAALLCKSEGSFWDCLHVPFSPEEVLLQKRMTECENYFSKR